MRGAVSKFNVACGAETLVDLLKSTKYVVGARRNGRGVVAAIMSSCVDRSQKTTVTRRSSTPCQWWFNSEPNN